MRRRQHHHAFAQLLLQIVYQGAQLAAFQRVGAQRNQAHTLHLDRATESFIESPGGGLHARFFQLAAQALELVFRGGQLGAECLRRAAAGWRGRELRGDLCYGAVLPESDQGAEAADGFEAPHT